MDRATSASQQSGSLVARLRLNHLFLGAVQAVVAVLVVLVILVMFVGLGKVLVSAASLFSSSQPLGTALNVIIGDILGLLVVIELFRSFIEYQECQRLRVHSLLSAALVFVVRELILTIYGEHQIDPLQLVGFGIAILALGAVRALAIRYSPDSPSRDFLARPDVPRPNAPSDR